MKNPFTTTFSKNPENTYISTETVWISQQLQHSFNRLI